MTQSIDKYKDRERGKGEAKKEKEQEKWKREGRNHVGITDTTITKVHISIVIEETLICETDVTLIIYL